MQRNLWFVTFVNKLHIVMHVSRYIYAKNNRESLTNVDMNNQRVQGGYLFIFIIKHKISCALEF